MPLSQVQMKVTSNASCPRKGLVKWAATDWISQAAHTCCHPVKAPQRVALSLHRWVSHTRTRGTDTWGNIR